jgi:cytochrome P450
MGAEIPRLETAVDYIPPIPFDLDPPHHGEIRRVLDAHLPLSAVDRLKPSVRASARVLTAQLSARGDFELMDDLAVPLVAAGMRQLLGIREPDERVFIGQSRELMRRMRDPSGTASWERMPAQGMVGGPPEPPYPPLTEQRHPLEKQILRAIKTGTGNEHGLLAALSRATWRTYLDDRVTEIFGIAVGLLGTALANTVPVLVSAVEHLGTHPEDRVKMLTHQGHVAHAVEEILRLYPPQSPGRIAFRDTRFADEEIRVGDSIMASISQANRDPEIFPDPDKLVLDRPVRSHLAFGAGRHRCVGASFARMVMTLALEEFHALTPNFHISGESAPVGDSPLRPPWKRLWIEAELELTASHVDAGY